MIQIAVKPVFQVIPDKNFEESIRDKGKVEYCFNCGSPYFYITTEKSEDKEEISYFCAVCGQYQGGWTLPTLEKELTEQKEENKK